MQANLTGRTDLVIAGGGIGGLVAALALARTGKTVRVLERAPEFGEIGAGLQIGPNASRILDSLGVLDRVVRDAFFPERLVLRDALSGEEVVALRAGEEFRERYGYPYYVTHRADLHAALAEACERESHVELIAGKSVVGFEEETDAVHLRCEDGTSYTASVLVGADGIRSSTRESVIGDGEPYTTGYVAYRGTVPVQDVCDAMGVSELNDMVIWMGPARHLVQYPVRGGRVCNQVAVFQSHRFLQGEEEWGTSEELDEAFSVAYEPVKCAAKLMNRDRRWQMFDRSPASGWSQGRVTLLGDAAHPMFQYLAQGACQAMEDGIVLAQSLVAERDPGVALKAYETERFPRVSTVQTRARMFGELLHAEGAMAAFRNHMLAGRSDVDFSDVDWLYGLHVLGDHAVAS